MACAQQIPMVAQAGSTQGDVIRDQQFVMPGPFRSVGRSTILTVITVSEEKEIAGDNWLIATASAQHRAPSMWTVSLPTSSEPAGCIRDSTA